MSLTPEDAVEFMEQCEREGLLVWTGKINEKGQKVYAVTDKGVAWAWRTAPQAPPYSGVGE